MPSTLSWLDFAESDRQQAMRVIDFFREKSTVDELGFAPIRDAFADHLFPGTSTIQTRARYFLFVPWAIKRYEFRKLTSQELPDRFRRRETRLIKALIAGDEHQGGIIGRAAVATLQRMPSSVYWRGLHQWGIRLFTGSIDQYFRHIVKARSSLGQAVVTDDGEPLSAVSRNWHPALPQEPDGLYESAKFNLPLAEAEFLRERICASQPSSMLAHVVNRAIGELDAEFAWDESLAGMLTPELRATVQHARLFSLCAAGGPLTYSLMLAEMKGNSELVAKLQVSLTDWQRQLGLDSVALGSWDRAAFWKLVLQINSRLSARTKAFAGEWTDIAIRAAGGERVWHDAPVRKRVERRELELKGARARLRIENSRARDLWQGDADGGMMDYRWGSAQTVLNDILTALHSPSAKEGA